jgi:hypothetical protein
MSIIIGGKQCDNKECFKKAIEEPNECAPYLGSKVCLSKKTLLLAANVANISIKPFTEPSIGDPDEDNTREKLHIWKQIAPAYDNEQINILNHYKIKDILGSDTITREQSLFKIAGPTDSTWLSNDDIDDTMKQWSIVFKDFLPLSFNMIDFMEYNSSLKNVLIPYEYSQNKYRTIATVINTDKFIGGKGGKHWTALFIDMRDTKEFTVEFFNSTGGIPDKSIRDWETMAIDSIRSIGATDNVKIVNAIGRQHQRSNSECGVYSLYYIYSRLINVAPRYFMENTIRDDEMRAFRKKIFRPKK